MTYITHNASPIGILTLSADPSGEALTGLWMEGQLRFGSTLEADTQIRPDLPVFLRASQWLERYFAGERPDGPDLPLRPEGSGFCREVWELLRQIPYGEVRTYGELAAQLASRMGRTSMSAQAVGGAVGRNPISILIPCHRVVGSHGALTGYAGGLFRKRWLLTLESSGAPRSDAVTAAPEGRR